MCQFELLNTFKLHVYYISITFDPSIYIMYHPDLIVCTCMANSIGLKRGIKGHRRGIISGPEEEIIECRRHERGSSKGALSFSLSGLPLRKCWIFSAFMCVLMGFYAFWTRFQSWLFARKDISCPVRNRMRNKIVSYSHVLFLRFSSAYFLDIMSPMLPQVLAKNF